MDINQLWADEMNGKVPQGSFRKAIDAQPKPYSATLQADMQKRIAELEEQLHEMKGMLITAYEAAEGHHPEESK